MPLMYRKRVLAAKLEGTYGTYEALANTDAGFRVIDPDMQIVGQVIEREKSNGELGTDLSVPGEASMTLGFKNHMHGDGSSGEPGWASIFFPCVGMPANNTGGTSFQTSSTQSNWKSFSALLNRDGRRRFGRGFMGNLSMLWEAGKPVENTWSFLGGYHEISDNNPDDTSLLTGMSYESVVPPIFAKASAFTIDGSTAIPISRMTIDVGAESFLRHDPNSLGGYIGGYIGNIKPKITVDPEAVAIATKNWAEYYRAGTTFSIVAVAGTATGNTITATATTCQITRFPQEGERNGMTIDNLEIQVNGTLTVAFT